MMFIVAAIMKTGCQLPFAALAIKGRPTVSNPRKEMPFRGGDKALKTVCVGPDAKSQVCGFGLE